MAIGKIDNNEVDFIANKPQEKIYFQVTESLENENVREREIGPLLKIKDNYEKFVLSLDEESEVFHGVKVINLLEWLLEE